MMINHINDGDNNASTCQLHNRLNKPILVEFFGLPGAGKTTLSNFMNRRLINNGFCVADRFDLMRWVQQHSILFKASIVLKNPSWAVHFLYHMYLFSRQHIAPNSSVLKKIIKSANNLIYLDSFIEHRRTDILILDQWSIQNIWSNWIGYKAIDEKSLRRNVAYTEKFNDKKYIFFKISPQKAATRIAGRTNGYSRFDDLDYITIKDRLLNEEKLMYILLNTIKSQKKDILVLDTHKSTATNTEIALEWLNPCLGNRVAVPVNFNETSIG